MMTGLTVLLSPLLGYLTLRAGSVIAAAIFHGTFNATAELAILVVQGGSDLIVGVTGLAGFIVLLLINIGLFFLDRRFLINAIIKPDANDDTDDRDSRLDGEIAQSIT